ncbi:MAG: phage major capsid protein [Terracidiphilus sp.]
MNYFEMRKAHAHALDKAETIMTLAENAKRPLTAEEQADVDQCMLTSKILTPQIQALQAKNTLATAFNRVGGAALLSGGVGGPGSPLSMQAPKQVLSPDYIEGFYSYVASGGKEISAALYEGAGSSGGYTVPIVVQDQIVPLAPNEMAIRQLATIIPTTSDIKIPQQLTFATAALKAESGATTTTFAESDPTLGQFTLSAYMAGVVNTLSWELCQDVPTFQAFAVTDMVLAQQLFEENLYVNGTGTGQAQGLIGNVGAGTTEEPDSQGNLVSLYGILDLIGTLKTAYHANASFLMARATGVIIRKAQVQSNLFEPAWTRVGGQDFLFGYPVYFSASMPAAARSAAPVLFGDFKLGYVIGDRGGSGINVKVLDQPLATQGQLQLLTYRRTDGRVRRSEAIQQYNVAAS